MKRDLAEIVENYVAVMSGTGVIIFNQKTNRSATDIVQNYKFGFIVVAMVSALGNSLGAPLNTNRTKALSQVKEIKLKQVTSTI